MKMPNTFLAQLVIVAGVTFSPAVFAQQDTTQNAVVGQIDGLNGQGTNATPPTAVTGLSGLLVGKTSQGGQIEGFNGQTTTMEGADATTAPNGGKINGLDGSDITK